MFLYITSFIQQSQTQKSLKQVQAFLNKNYFQKHPGGGGVLYSWSKISLTSLDFLLFNSSLLPEQEGGESFDGMFAVSFSFLLSSSK